ncbi:MAG: hypothetical protein IJB70_09910 [Clostridia bacterium]|nr:hypothetical protein [Clostridia bacterium]
MICEMLNCLCKPAISPDGWLSFIGELLGAAATIIAVIATIKYEKAKEIREKIIEAKPWLTTNNELISNKKRFNELIENDILYVHKNGAKFGTSKIIPPSLKNENYQFNQNQCIVNYTFLNGGGNTATLLSVKLNNEELLPPFCLTTNREQRWILILQANESDSETPYTLTFTYGDIVSDTKYIQTETLRIKKDSVGVTLVQNVDEVITQPEKIGGKSK